MKIAAYTLAAIVVAGAAAPAFAESLSDFDKDHLIAGLRDRGVVALEVYENGDNRIRAVVQTADGSQVFQYFYEDTLNPVVSSHGQTRVLTERSVSDRGVPQQNPPQSLLVDTFFD